MRTQILVVIVLGFLLLAAGSGVAHAASTGAIGASAPAGTQGRFDPQAATQAYLAEMTTAQKQRSDAYFEGGYWLQLWNFVYGIGMAALLLFTRLSARMRDLAERITRRRWLQSALYAVGYIVFISVVSLPLSIYADYLREHAYGLSNLSLGGWFIEQGKGLIIGLIFGAIAITAIFAIIRRFPRRWWLLGAGFAVAFAAFSMIIAPVYLEPVFNHFKSLPSGPVRSAVVSLARANGVPADNIYEYDASRQSNRISAHVSGFLGTTQISLNDNLLKRADLHEIRAVMAHEIGHYVLHHAAKGLLAFGLVLVGAFAFVSWAMGALLRRWGDYWAVRGVEDVAALPLLAAVFSAFMFVMTPVTNTISRTMEAEADIFGLNAAREPDGFARAALSLSEYRKMSPGPVEEIVFYDHPSGRDRILMAMRWKAEHLPACDGGSPAPDAAKP